MMIISMVMTRRRNRAGGCLRMLSCLQDDLSTEDVLCLGATTYLPVHTVCMYIYILVCN